MNAFIQRLTVDDKQLSIANVPTHRTPLKWAFAWIKFKADCLTFSSGQANTITFQLLNVFTDTSKGTEPYLPTD